GGLRPGQPVHGPKAGVGAPVGEVRPEFAAEPKKSAVKAGKDGNRARIRPFFPAKSQNPPPGSYGLK
ncbi:MAG TPA: hypothetical protein VFA86_07395, partial [Gammaproteobacteria bacterium]|nr:hypothetical protein [Gammaproteobacteria bacterium]